MEIISLIVKLVGRTIGYQFLLRRLQTMGRVQHPFSLIDLSNDYFFVRFTSKEDYESVLLNGPGL